MGANGLPGHGATGSLQAWPHGPQKWSTQERASTCSWTTSGRLPGPEAEGPVFLEHTPRRQLLIPIVPVRTPKPYVGTRSHRPNVRTAAAGGHTETPILGMDSAEGGNAPEVHRSAPLPPIYISFSLCLCLLFFVNSTFTCSRKTDFLRPL